VHITSWAVQSGLLSSSAMHLSTISYIASSTPVPVLCSKLSSTKKDKSIIVSNSLERTC
jgi:hypothetical protein